MTDNSDRVSSIEGIIGQLIRAIRAGGGALENHLREILAPVVTDVDIHKALFAAARGGSVVACRLLWGKFSQRGKRKYSKAAAIDDDTPLHVAAFHGHLEVVRLFINEFKWNINQKNIENDDKTPLCYPVTHLETARFLLENGANVNLGGPYGPLWFAVHANNTQVSRLLLIEYQANPNLNRRSVDEEHDESQPWYNTDLAIYHGNEEILRMLLKHGAFIGDFLCAHHGTSLNKLLRRTDVTRETKLNICRILIEHAKEDHATAAFMQASFEFAAKRLTVDDIEGGGHHHILLEAGIDPRMAMYCAIKAKNLSVCQLLMHEYHVDPFLEEEEESNEPAAAAAASPFLAAARLTDTRIFGYLLEVWRFSSSGGKNSDGDYPIHVVCCDPLVSLQAIMVLVNRQADALAVVDGEQGLLPFHFAANWGASLDVIFYLLQHCPNALRHVGNATASATAAATAAATEVGPCPPSSFPAAVGTSGSTNGKNVVETKGDDDNKQQSAPHDGPARKKAKTRHSG